VEYGQVIKKIRKEKKMTSSELAKKAGVSQPYLSQLETGKNNNPTNGVIKKIADGLDVSFIHLLNEVGYFEGLDDKEKRDESLKSVYAALSIEELDEISINKINTGITLGKVFTLDPDQRLSHGDSKTVSSIMTKVAFMLYHGLDQWGTEPLMKEINEMIEDIKGR